ncbi:MAG: cation diffusion facilitator family transporter [Jatrophihabitantaceae bacterium]|nr:cation diffusion facilitator family transporter [Jatrophihabitantaceae bacterium]
MSDGHAHGGHGHSHVPTGPLDADRRRRLLLALGITLAILIAEVVGAVLTGSLALLTDAAHMLTDVAGLAVAVVAASLATRPATDRRTYGFRRSEILSAALQALVLLTVGVFVLIEAVRRLADPPEVAALGIVIFGVIGLTGNAIAIALLARDRGANMNFQAAFLEVVNDALGSVAVIAAGTVIAITGWARADAVASIAIAVLILPRTLLLLRDSVHVLLEATPKSVPLSELRAHLLEVDHVRGVHDLHVTAVSSDMPVLSAHIIIDDGCFLDGHVPTLLDQLQACVSGHFDVEHSTFQLEPAGHAEHEGTPAH